MHVLPSSFVRTVDLLEYGLSLNLKRALLWYA